MITQERGGTKCSTQSNTPQGWIQALPPRRNRDPQLLWDVQKWMLERGCCRVPGLSKAICSVFGIWRQQEHSWSATALSRFAEHGVSGMCWVPACRTGGTGRINSFFTGVLILLQVNSVEKLFCCRQWEEPAESLPHKKPFPALQ